MNTCSTCKHWVEINDDYRVGYGTGVKMCRAVVMFWDATEWNEDCDGRKVRNEFQNTKAFVQDGSDYKAYLLTMPDFGCVLHEPTAVEIAQP